MSKSARRWAIRVVVVALLAAWPAWGKRGAPIPVAPLEYQGIRYVAPNTNGREGILEAWDMATGTLRWRCAVYRNRISSGMEEDVQWIFVKMLAVEDGKIVVTDESGRQYRVDPLTGHVDSRSLTWLAPVTGLVGLSGLVLLAIWFVNRKGRLTKTSTA